MKRDNKTIAALLLASMLLLTACGGNDGADEQTEAADNTETTTNAEIVTEVDYDPHIEAVDFDGEEFMVIYGDNDLEPNYDIRAEEENGEPLNDAVFKRNLSMEEKYNVDINWSRHVFHHTENILKTAANADEDVYDLHINAGTLIFKLAAEGYSQRLNDFPYIDFSKPYWNSNMLEGSSINGSNYFAYSDINMFAAGATPTVLFNKKVAEDHGITDLYRLVEDGRWTMDAMHEYIKQVTSDADGDGIIGANDNLGFIGNTFVIDCLLSGTGYQTIIKDSDDLPVINIQTEKYYGIIDKIMKLCAEENGAFICDRHPEVDREYAPMEAIDQDRALFWIGNLHGVQRMRSMESPLGILPIPKYDDTQEEYKIHYQATVGGAMSVPITVNNTDLVGMLLEDMSYISMKTVKPVYVDILLEGKFLRDEESLVTLEIMFDSYYSDIGFMTGMCGINILNDMREYIKDNSTSYVSTIEARMTGYQARLDSVVDVYLSSSDGN